MSDSASTVDIDVKIGGTEIPDSDIIGFSIDCDLGQPDMAVITLRNDTHAHTKARKPAEAVEILTTIATDPAKVTIFKGEVVGVEPTYRAGGESKVVVRAFNKLHRLSKGKKSKTYQDQSDQDICSTIAGVHSLQAECGSSPKITHKHVYQHNQTDLEFLRVRAARLGFSVWVDDAKLFFDAPKVDQDSGIELKLTDNQASAHFLKMFAARLSSAAVVNKVTVRGWDPVKKEEVVGEASAAASKLGGKHAASASGDFGQAVTFTVDHPIFSVDEAKAIAKAKLGELMMSFLTAEAECRGHSAYKPGIVVTIEVNKDDPDDPFNGKYLVAGVTHKYSHGGEGKGGGGYVSVLRLQRDAVKK